MLFAVCYGVGVAAFLALLVLMLINRPPLGVGLGIFFGCAVTAIWATFAAVQPWWMPGVAHAFESLASVAWLLVLGWIVSPLRHPEKYSRALAWFPLVLLAVALVSLGNDLRFVTSALTPWDFGPSQVLLRIVVAVCGILAIENLYRNATAGRRWHTLPFCIALGALFAYNLFVFCEAVVLKAADQSLLAARGLVLGLMVPPLALTMARNPDWKVDVHVSRDVVFHGATLFGAGIFVLAAAGVAGVIGEFPGQWASVSKIVFFCGSVILLLLVLSTESIRSRLRRVIAENFFSARYDYRAEWMRSIATLTTGAAGESLHIRAIRTLADVVDSPGGVLWMENACGDYVVQQAMNMKADPSAIEPRGGAFLQAFAEGEAVQDLTEVKGLESKKFPGWVRSSPAWLAIPLMKVDQLIGFVVLAPPRAPALLNWESRNLLLTIGQQVAGFLAEERATRALLESQALIDYSKRFSFVVHDIKNVAGQLGLMVANIQKFGDRAEFRSDLIRGIENSVRKLDDLVARVRPNTPAAEAAKVNAASVIDEVIKDLDTPRIQMRAESTAIHACVRIAPSALHAIVTHLAKNAIEASAEGDSVTIEISRDRGRIAIDVIDTGCGMSTDFVRNSLFTPLRSTKQRGHGIGAFQARDLARAAGGDIEVTSEIGRGTTMRIVLPEYKDLPAGTFAPKAVLA